MKKYSTALLWFRRDLRLRDHEPLHRALAEAEQVIPLFIVDPAWAEDFPWDFPKMDQRPRQFLRESLAELEKSLAELGASLQIRFGAPAQIMADIYQEEPFEAIYSAAEQSREEQEQEEAVALWAQAQDCHYQRQWNYSLYRPEDLPLSPAQYPSVFTAMRKKMEKFGAIAPSLDPPSVFPSPRLAPQADWQQNAFWPTEPPQEEVRAVLPFKGGEKHAWARLEHYFWQSQKLLVYKETRNGLLGADYSSKFSPWLAWGCISPRSIYWEIRRFEQQYRANSSTYWLYFELMWRDFFRLRAHAEGDAFFHMPRQAAPRAFRHFEAWRAGETGQDFVDANMRELRLSGFMSNRGRQNVASYLVKDLKESWIIGAAWFQSQLIDYDVCSNYGNWTYVAGLGHDPRENRYFNVAGQAERYDGEGAYRRHWRK